ncbi:MAG: PorV/PorQ family protein [Elusimicrobiota bacterium]|jgi:hypothetical protein
MNYRQEYRVIVFLIASALSRTLYAAAGTEAASFLDIPVGAGPASLGAAYSARAEDAYATVWNPAGLGFLECPQLAGTHQPYLESVHYEYLSYVHPLGTKEPVTGRTRRGFGSSIQYLGSGDLDRRDEIGTPMGTFSSYYAAYSLAYGQRWRDHWSFGAAAKAITAKISDASAMTGAADLGVLYKPMDRFSLGAVAANLGPNLKFVNEGDPLPMAFRLGGLYALDSDWNVSAEGVYRRTGLLSGSIGAEYIYEDVFTVRCGYNTSHTKELSLMSGFSSGFGLFLWGQELSYAWVPFGELGTSHYFSLVLRFGQTQSSRPSRQKTVTEANFEHPILDESGYQNLYDVLNPDERKALQPAPARKGKDSRP